MAPSAAYLLVSAVALPDSLDQIFGCSQRCEQRLCRFPYRRTAYYNSLELLDSSRQSKESLLEQTPANPGAEKRSLVDHSRSLHVDQTTPIQHTSNLPSYQGPINRQRESHYQAQHTTQNVVSAAEKPGPHQHQHQQKALLPPASSSSTHQKTGCCSSSSTHHSSTEQA